jgi:hypothetical protein
MNNKKKLAVISLVVMMMITAVGYAAFSDSLDLQGTATNASFDVQFVYADQADYSANVARVVIGQQTNDGDDGKYDSLSVAISNIVPGEKYTVKFGVKNNGSVPAYFNGFSLDPVDAYNTKMAENYIQQVLQDVSTAVVDPGETEYITYEFGLKDTVDATEGVTADDYKIQLAGKLNLTATHP